MCTIEPEDVGYNAYNIEDKGNVIKHTASKEFATQLALTRNNMFDTVCPQLLTEPLLFIPVSDILELFFDEEKKLWQRVVQSPFLFEETTDSDFTQSRRSNQTPLPFENDGEQDTIRQLIGRAFLNHAESCNEIHQYFLKLDPRRCCVNARVVDESNTFQQPGPLRLVKSSADELEKNREGSRKSNRGSKKTKKQTPPQRNRVIFIHKLSATEEMIYKKLLLCAFQPVLSCPISEPSVVSPEAVAQDWNLSKSKSESLESFIEATAVEPQFLFDMIMHAFQINQNYHLKLRDELKRQLPNRDTSRALAVDLGDQLHRLQANECIFYRSDVFQNPDCYEEWRQKQISFVEKLMNKWCPDYSDINSYKIVPFDAHTAFVVVVNKLLSYDVKEKLNVVRDRPKTMMSLLTTNSTRLLKEFCLRYGICRIYQQITILSAMIDQLDYTDWYLSCLETMLLETMEYVGKKQRFLVKKERVMIKESIERLHRKVEYGFIKLYTLYPTNVSTEGVRLMLVLFNTVIETRKNFDSREAENLLDISTMIKQYMKIAVVENYNTIKEKNELEHSLENDDPYRTKYSVDLYVSVLQDIGKNVRILTDLVENCSLFKSSCEDIIKWVAQQFYSLYMADVKKLCYSSTATIHTSEVNYQMIGLSFRLDQFDRDWNHLITPLNQRWRYYYKVVLNVAIIAIKEYIIRNIPNYIKSDRGQLLNLSYVIPEPKVRKVEPSSLPIESFQPIGYSNLDRKGSSAFIPVRRIIRNELRKGSKVNFEVNLKKEWCKSQISLGSDIKGFDSDNSGRASPSSHASLGSISSAEYDELDNTPLQHTDGGTRVDQSDPNNNIVADEFRHRKSFDSASEEDDIEERSDSHNDRILSAAHFLVRDVIRRAVDSLEDTKMLDKTTAMVDTEPTGREKGRGTVEKPLDNTDQKDRNDKTALLKDDIDYRVNTFKPFDIGKHLTEGDFIDTKIENFDDQPGNRGVVRRKAEVNTDREDTNKNHSYEEDDDDELMREITFDNTNKPTCYPSLKTRPSSQPRSWSATHESDSQAAMYSKYGPIDTGFMQQDVTVASSYDSISSLQEILEENKKLNKDIDKLYQESIKKESQTTLTETSEFLKHPGKSLPLDIERSGSESIKVKEGKGINVDQAQNVFKSNEQKSSTPAEGTKKALNEKGFVMSTSSLTDILVAIGRLTSFSVDVCSLIIPSTSAESKEEARHEVDSGNGNANVTTDGSNPMSKSRKNTRMHDPDETNPQTFAPKPVNGLQAEMQCEQDKNFLQYIRNATRIDTFEKVLSSIKEILINYASSVLVLDLCGSKLFEEHCTFTKEDIKLLKRLKAHHEDLVPGCRHCLTRDARLLHKNQQQQQPKQQQPKQQQPKQQQHGDEVRHLLQDPCPFLEKLLTESLGSWEIISKEMCFRVNNIYSLLQILPLLQQKVADSLKVDIELMLRKSEEQMEASASYSDKGPSYKPKTSPYSSLLCRDFRLLQEFLESVLNIQIKLITWKTIMIFNRLFDSFFSIAFHNRSLHEHMSTCKLHLRKQIKFFQHSMYGNCARLATLEIWKSIIIKYNKILDNIHSGRDNPRAKGKNVMDLLASTRTYLLADAQLEVECYLIMKPLLFRLQLYSIPFAKLRMIYEETLSDTVFNIYRKVMQEYTFEELVHMIRQELQKTYRSTFTGSALLDLLRSNESWVERLVSILQFPSDFTWNAKGICIAKRFLRKQIMRECGTVPTPRPTANLSVVMVPPPGSPNESFQAPVTLLDPGITIDLLDKEPSNNTNDSNESVGSNNAQPPSEKARFQDEFYEEGVYYTFQTLDGSPSDIEYIGKLHNIVRTKGSITNTSIQKDIVEIFRYEYRYNRTEEVRAFFHDFALNPTHHNKSCSCSW